MSFMYDQVYGGIMFGHTKGLMPFYKLLNQLFRFTMTPRGGDSENISHWAKNLLFRMAPSQGTFSVSNFLWNEIAGCSHDAKSACHYAPYIFHIVKEMTQLDITPSKVHLPYKPPKGKLEQLLKVGRHATNIAPRVSTRVRLDPGASSSHGPSTGPHPSPSRGPSTHAYGPPMGKKGKLAFLFACFNVCWQISDDAHKHRQYLEEERIKLETRQKEIMTKLDIPHSPIRQAREFTPPPPIYNPCGETGSSSQAHYFGAFDEEEDFGGMEEPSHCVPTPVDDDESSTDGDEEERNDDGEEEDNEDDEDEDEDDDGGDDE